MQVLPILSFCDLSCRRSQHIRHARFKQLPAGKATKESRELQVTLFVADRQIRSKLSSLSDKSKIAQISESLSQLDGIKKELTAWSEREIQRMMKPSR